MEIAIWGEEKNKIKLIFPGRINKWEKKNIIGQMKIEIRSNNLKEIDGFISSCELNNVL